MIAGLGRFVDRLRREGLDVSPAELIDAVHALEHAGIEDRDRFRAALRTTLAKTARQVRVFDAVFDEFFVPPARAPRRGKAPGPGAAGEGVRRGPSRVENEAARAGRPPDRRGGGERRERPSSGDADELRRTLREVSEGSRRHGRLRHALVDRGPEAGRESAADAAADPATRPLDVPLPTAEERRVAREVPRQIEQLRLRRSRRHRRARHGRVWLRKVYRESLAHGGVPFTLPLRRPGRRRPRVVLLVDVSYSVARSAGLFLWMAAEFLELGRRTRVLLFVDRPVEATDRVRAWARGRHAGRGRTEGGADRAGRGRPRPGAGVGPAGRGFTELLDSIEDLNLSAPSDYGRTLHRLLRSRSRPRGRDAVLLVLGDARTNRFDPLPWALEEIARQARAIVWLVPEPRQRWGTGDSALADYLPHIDTLVEARNLEGLARGLGVLVRRLS